MQLVAVCLHVLFSCEVEAIPNTYGIETWKLVFSSWGSNFDAVFFFLRIRSWWRSPRQRWVWLRMQQTFHWAKGHVETPQLSCGGARLTSLAGEPHWLLLGFIKPMNSLSVAMVGFPYFWSSFERIRIPHGTELSLQENVLVALYSDTTLDTWSYSRK